MPRREGYDTGPAPAGTAPETGVQQRLSPQRRSAGSCLHLRSATARIETSLDRTGPESGGRVALTHDARDSRSRLSQFLDNLLPNRSLVVNRWRTELENTRRKAVPVADRIVGVGRAFEMRVGLDLADRPGYWQALACLPPDVCRRLLVSAGFKHPPDDSVAPTTEDPVLRSWSRSGRPGPDDPDQEVALLASVEAGWCDQLTHNLPYLFGVEGRRSYLAAVRPIPGQNAAGTLTPGRAGSLDTLSRIWAVYVRFGREQLLALGDRVTLEPKLAQGYATADLVVGNTLVEIKAALEPETWMDQTVNQLLGYLLLDRWNTFELTEIALYTAWEARCLRMTVEELLHTASAGKPLALEELRNELHSAIAEDLERAEAATLQHRYTTTHYFY